MCVLLNRGSQLEGWEYLGYFWAYHTGKSGAAGIRWVEAKNAKYFLIYRTFHHNKKLFGPKSTI